TGDIYINVIKNEFIMINGTVKIPKIPVKELDYNTAVTILEEAVKYIPEFLCGHDLLVDRKPAAEQHALHFVKAVNGIANDYIHIFKLYLKFEGDSRNVIDRGDTSNYPSYSTDRYYYKSRIIPVSSVTRDKDKIDFKPIRIITPDSISTDQKLFTSAIFDDLDRKELTRDIHKKLGLDIFSISTELYPFIVFDYFTACFNVLYPSSEEIEKAVRIFEPIFISAMDKYGGLLKLKNYEDIKSRYKDQLYFIDESFIKIKFMDELKSYFQRWSLYRDDDLTLKGWWRFVVNQ
ncbi:MAG: hypothetical protein MUC95_06465, partial [Spirochaetes bacterium]|nr:hypothetical protein [Spirochaetota bacterium]